MRTSPSEMDEGAHLPGGTVTFLFTDVEGSTKLFERHADEYRHALLRHDAILRAAVAEHGGHVFETVGDAFYAVFAEPRDAVAAAFRAQVELAAEDWGELGTLRIRIGLHTGEVERRGRHYFGHTLYRCARIMATAHGGQVVLSSVTSDLVRDSLPDGAGLRSLGTHRLKDLGEPEQIFQLVHPSLRSDLPPLKSLNTLLNNLPQQVTSFIGREQEMSEVRPLLARSRLLTLLGMGGTGKTRLALQVAADVLDAHPDGVWFVDLAPLADEGLVPQAIASALGVREESGRALTTTLQEHLRPKRLLLLLDNCEHLIDALAPIADALLRTCPHVTLLATSRQPLGISGETIWRVPPLGLPDPALVLTEAFARSEAVRLFVDRACASLSAFCLTPQNAPAIADIVRRVDGIPLAIELAAARVRALSPQQIAERLEQRFTLLTGGSRAALPRQRTLRALVDWSYDLLDPDERRLFDRLSVFAGSWTLEAAEAICAAAPLERYAVLDLLTKLVDRSLVVADGGVVGATEYRLLETLREYGRDRLRQRGEEDATRRLHAEHYLSLAERAEQELTGPRQAEWLQRLERVNDDLRSALQWSIDQSAAEIAWRLGGALYRFWSRHGYFTEGRARLELVLALPPREARSAAARGARAKALHGAATIAVQQGEYASARKLFEESLALKRELGEPSAIAATLNNLGVVARYQGDYLGARELFEETLALQRQIGDRWGIAHGLNNLGAAAHSLRDFGAARRLFEEGLSLRRELADRWGIANSLENLGNVALDEGDHAAARRYYAESLELDRELGEKRAIAGLLEDFGALAAAQKRPRVAMTLVAAATALRATIGAPLPMTEQERLERFFAPARELLRADEIAAAGAEGRAMSLEDAMAAALLAPDMALEIDAARPGVGSASP